MWNNTHSPVVPKTKPQVLVVLVLHLFFFCSTTTAEFSFLYKHGKRGRPSFYVSFILYTRRLPSVIAAFITKKSIHSTDSSILHCAKSIRRQTTTIVMTKKKKKQKSAIQHWIHSHKKEAKKRSEENAITGVTRRNGSMFSDHC